jgi:orotate phosphoribosyltransferase
MMLAACSICGPRDLIVSKSACAAVRLLARVSLPVGAGVFGDGSDGFDMLFSVADSLSRDRLYTARMERKEIASRICETALLHGEFTLRSGRISKYYLDKYLFETQPDILKALGGLFAEHIGKCGQVHRLAGAELGGIPLVTSASMATGLPTVLIRNQKKDYGTAKQLEGKLEAGENIVIVEDVATTGGQVLEAAKVIEETGAKVVKIIAVIDRQEGARENVEGAGYGFDALFTKADLGIDE